MINEKVIFGTGFSCVDIIKLPENNTILPGGTCANVISLLSFWGWDARLAKAKYDDIMNDFFDSCMDLNGVKIINYYHSKKSMPRVIQNNEDSEHSFSTTCPICGKKLNEIDMLSQTRTEIVIDYMDNANVLYFDRISPGIKELCTIAYEQKTWIIYEPNGCRSYRNLLNNALLSNILKFSSERISIRIADRLKIDLEFSAVEIIIVTLAENGLVFSYKKRDRKFSDWIIINNYNDKKITDSSGAGDWVTAGFIDSFISIYPKYKKRIRKKDIIMSLSNAMNLLQNCFDYYGAQGYIYEGKDLKKVLLNNKKCNLCFR